MNRDPIIQYFKIILMFLIVFSIYTIGEAAPGKWIRIGDFQNFFQAHGCEPEEDFGDQQQYGCQWPALYRNQDMQAARGMWIGVKNYFDPVVNKHFDYKVVHCGPRPRSEIEINEFMPVQFDLAGRRDYSAVLINGNSANANQYDQLDFIDQNLDADLVLFNVVNTTVGITMHRKIYVFSQQNYDDFMIYEYTFTNTGICNLDGSITHQNTLEDVYFHWQYRNAICKEGTVEGTEIDLRGNPGWGTIKDMRWGKNTMNDILGENPDNPQTSSGFPNGSLMDQMNFGVDETDDYGEWIRCIYSWHGKHSESQYDNIGSSCYYGYWQDGRLGASQFTGIVTLHADKSAIDKTNDIYQPSTTRKIESDDPATMNNDQFSASRMKDEYERFCEFGHSEKSQAEEVGDGFPNIDAGVGGGGFSQAVAYGPYTLAPGDSIRIIIAEAAGGLSRSMNFEVGQNWYRAMNGEQVTLILPDESITDDPNEYKNSWVYTGRDSLLNTFKRAIRAHNQGLENLPKAPSPPAVVEIQSFPDHIQLNWSDNAESDQYFAGYRVYRSVAGFDRQFQMIFACGQGTDQPLIHSYQDMAVVDTIGYLYAITTFDDGTVNQLDPGIPLESSIYYTLSQSVGLSFNNYVDADLYISPNGNDDNSGLTQGEPLKTIRYAQSRIYPSILNPHTIYLAEGVYGPETNGEVFPLTLKHHVTIQGKGKYSTILDANWTYPIFETSGKSNCLKQLSLTHGQGNKGGAISVSSNDFLSLVDVRIVDNHAMFGGGIYVNEGGTIQFDQETRSTIHSNYASEVGNDIYSLSLLEVYVDTFSVSNPCDYYTYPVDNITINAEEYLVSQVTADLYVNPNGDDDNNGLSLTSPLKTIRHAISIVNPDSVNHLIIHLSNGKYSPSSTGEQFPIYLRDYIILSGDSNLVTEIDAENSGPVIICNKYQNAGLENLLIKGGTTSAGGGIYINNSDIKLKNLDITNNQAFFKGGGLIINNSKVQFEGCSIYDNNASNGGGICFLNTNQISFDSLNRCNIYSNIGSDLGSDLFAENVPEPIHVILDTFTLQYPLIEYVYPLDKFTFDIQNALIPQENADLYVSTTGNNANSGLSPNEPLKTISYTLKLIFVDAENPHTIFLDEGIYSNTTINEIYPIQLRNNITLQGKSPQMTILDAEYLSRILNCENIQSVKLRDLSIRNGRADYGGGLYCNGSTIKIQNVTFIDDSAKYGGAIYCENSDIKLFNSFIVENTANFGSAINARASHVFSVNVTIANNYSLRYPLVYSRESSSLYFVNTILWNPSGREFSSSSSDTFIVANCDVEGGQNNSGFLTTDFQHWLDGNIDTDPLFTGGDPFSYDLTANSPCNNAGTSILIFEGDTLVYLPDTLYNGSLPPIGALSGEYTSSISEIKTSPEKFVIHPNYPNPFNPTTTIRYDLPTETNVQLLVYNILGCEVRKLTDQYQLAGRYSLVWDGKDNNGRNLSSGTYILIVKTDFNSSSMKMLLIK